MKKYFAFRITIFVSYCILINFFGKLMADRLQLPFWLDSIGTVSAGYVLGPVCGGIVGAAVNLMYGVFSASSYHYAITNVLVGVLAGILSRKKMFKDLFHAFSLSMILAVVCTITSLPMNIFLYDGLPGNLWGDAVVHYFQELGALNFFCYFSGEFCVDLLDKIISVGVVYVTLKLRERRIAIRGGVHPFLGILFVLLLSLGMKNTAQAANDGKEQGLFDSYIQTVFDDNNGILGGTVNDISQTMDGLIWVGTYGGLYQYDGSHFTLMSDFESVRNVNCLYTDQEGRLWIGTNDSGLSICSDNRIVNVVDETGGLAANSVRSIVKNSDGLYFIGTAGAMCAVTLVDGINVVNQWEEMNYVNSLCADNSGYVCAVDSQGRLGLFQGSNLLRIFETTESGAGFTAAAFDTDGCLLVATTENQVQVYELAGDEMYLKKSYDCEGLYTINAIEKNDRGDMIVCGDNGIGYISESGKFSILVTPGFESSIDNILIDYQGNYWFSSSRLGLLELRETIFEDIYAKVGMDASVVNAVTFWRGNYYMGTDSGLDVMDSAYSHQIYNSITTLFSNVRIRCLTVDEQDCLWLATSGKGVFQLRSEDSIKQFTTEDGLISNKTRALLELEDGRMAVATDSGVSIIADGKVQQNFSTQDGMATDRTLCMLEYDGALYCGTDGGGIAVLREGKVERLIRRTDGIGSDIVLRLAPFSDGSGIFVITSNGISMINKMGIITQITKFPYYNNFDLIYSRDGKIWITSSAGIYIVDEMTLRSGGEVEYELLDSRKGMNQSLVANSWNYEDAEGNLILCGDTGAISINMSRYVNQHASYRITLETIVLDGVSVRVDKEGENLIGRDVSRIEFVPKVINFSVNDPYASVWLEGFDEQPRIMMQSELENMVYTNLPSGRYVFHLSILDGKMEKEVESVSYTFVKEKELYDNWWFVLYLFGMLAVVLIYLVWLLVGTQINKSIRIQRAEIENLRLKQEADSAVAAGEAKDRFLALMSHDLRTPINAILGMNEMIMRESSEEETLGYAKDIKGAGDTLLTLVNSILDFSKLENGKMVLLPTEYETRGLLHNLIQGTKSIADKKNLELQLDIEETIPTKLWGDDVRISQIISNLLSNAVKYTKQGFVRLSLREKEREGDRIVLYCEVKDSGIGIKKEDLNSLAVAFTRLEEDKNRNIEGTGLGISIVTNLLEMMGSKLQVESEYGVGSTFSFVLEQKIIDNSPMGPVNTREVVAAQERAEKHIYIPDAKILVVDDSDMNLKVAAGFLKANGVIPTLAESGEAALQLVQQQSYDLIFMDHMMPEKDGMETLQEMRSRQLLQENCKVVVLTANAINGAKDFYLKAGFDGYLTKPIEPDKLERMLVKYLGQMTKERPISEKAASAVNRGETAVGEAACVVKQDEKVAGEVASAMDAGTMDAGTMDDRSMRLAEACPEIDPAIGLKYTSDSWEFYAEMMHLFVDEYLLGNKLTLLEQHFENRDMNLYRTLVHSIKSSSLSLGAVSVSEEAKKLEMAAKENRVADVEMGHASFTVHLRSVLEQIRDYLEKEEM